MTPTRTAPRVGAIQSEPRHRGKEIVHGLAATLLLAGLVVGIPATLVLVAPIALPAAMPTWDQIAGALTRPDDGTLFLGALTLVAWAAWAAFTLCVLLEGIAQARGLPTPRLPGLRSTQRAAGVLVAAAGLLLAPIGAAVAPTATALTTTPSGSAAEAALLDGEGLTTDARAAAGRAARTPAEPPSRATAGDRVDSLPIVTVQRGDTLWRLAERHLGHGERFTEIVTLNAGRTQPDGRVLRDAHWIHPGWALRLPADATDVPASPARTTTGPSAHIASVHTHVVEPGDTLWGIASDYLGDGHRYTEIHELTAGRPQPDGRVLTDPDLIHPGWALLIPGSPDQVARPSPVATQPPAPPVENQPFGTPEPSPPPSGRDADVARAPEAAWKGDATPKTETEVDGQAAIASGDDAEAGGAGQDLFLGLTALASAGFVGEIARRRRRQQRLRRTGERIPLPTPGTPAAAAERELRRAPQDLTVETLKHALHALAPGCVAADRDLPRVGAIRVTPAAVELILTVDDPHPVAPFTALGPRCWTAPCGDLAAQEIADGLDDYPEPYPALVTIGADADAMIIVNLEAAGTLKLTGPDDDARAVLRAIACELATSALSDRSVLVVEPALGDLADACHSVTVAAAGTRQGMTRGIAAGERDASRALGTGCADDALAARSHLESHTTWNPTVFVGTDLPTDTRPWSGIAVVTTATSTPAGGWRLVLSPEGQARLEPLGLSQRPARLSGAAYASVLSVLRDGDVEPEPAPGAPAPTTGTETVEALAALPRPADPAGAGPSTAAGVKPEAPRVLLLGSVTVTGADRTSSDDRSRRNIELIAYLALNPGASPTEIDEVVGRGKRITPALRNTIISRARGWLGKDPDGDPYLLGFQGDDGYRLAPSVSTDWAEFLATARRGLAAGKAGVDDLETALRLVRGRPFLGAPPGTYDWAEAITQEMIATIVDVAHVLARNRLDAGDLLAAARAAAVGLVVDPCNEQLYRDAITAAQRRGDTGEVERLVGNLRAHIVDIDPDGDLDDLTVELLERLR